MTWLGDPDKKVPDATREALLKKREGLVKEVEDIKKAGPKGKMAHHQRHHLEDMALVAREIAKIDKKLGR